MKLKVCKGCFETFTDFNGNDYCNMCGRDIESGDDDWLELNQKEAENNGTK